MMIGSMSISFLLAWLTRPNNDGTQYSLFKLVFIFTEMDFGLGKRDPCKDSLLVHEIFCLEAREVALNAHPICKREEERRSGGAL